MIKLLTGLTLVAAFFSACGSDDGSPIAAQNWQGINIRVETRPSPPVAGMAEILVIATKPEGKPAYDLLVSLRTSDTDPWIQSIQDGHLGVYRRAAKLDVGERSTLQVKIQRGQEETVLYFPLKLSDQS